MGPTPNPTHTAPKRTPRLASVSSWKSNSSSGSAVVVFDTLEKRLYTAFEGDTTDCEKVPIKGRGTRPDIYLEVDNNLEVASDDQNSTKAKAWFASVDLSSLGTKTVWRRRKGSIPYIYVRSKRSSRCALMKNEDIAL